MINKQTVLRILEERKARLNDSLFDDELEVELDVLINKIRNLPEEDGWIPADNPPQTDNYVLLSFENFTLPLVGRYERYENGSGNYYIGDCNEEDTCLANDLFVNAWQPLPKSYRSPEKSWKGSMLNTFLGGCSQ